MPAALFAAEGEHTEAIEEPGDFAARVVERAGGDRQRQISEAFHLALGRPPSDEERDVCRQAIEASLKAEPAGSSDTQRDAVAMKVVCHALFNSASLLYVD